MPVLPMPAADMPVLPMPAADMPASHMPAVDMPVSHMPSTFSRARCEPHPGYRGRTVRIGICQLDYIQNRVFRLTKSASELIRILPKQLAKQLSGPIKQLEYDVSGLEDALSKLNTVPLADIFDRFPKIFAELTEKLNKKADLVIRGGDTRCDISFVAGLTQPLLHILRNSVDHGVESAEDRIAKGKPANGLVTVNAYSEGEEIIIEVEDDGAGVDVEKVRAKAVKDGIVTESEALNMPTEAVLNMIFLPSFSTREQVSMYSGRGVGMDVVREKTEELGGTVGIVSTGGRGTKIYIKLPYAVSASGFRDFRE
jgi:two-component system chemotaxis sensor kinase CheA